MNQTHHRHRIPACSIALAGFCALVSLTQPAMAASSALEAGQVHDMITPNGYTDWTRGVIVAKGLGVPPKSSANASQAKEMTRKAAWSVALRNLLEVAKGVNVDSATTVNNYVTVNDEVRTKVEGMVRGAKVVKEEELPDGSIETTVEMKLAGDFSDAVVPKPSAPKERPLERFAGLPAPSVSSKTYSGLVIDGRGTGAKPCMSPRILTEQGDEAYSIAYVEKSAVPTKGIIAYVSTEPAATSHPRVTSKPMMIKALRADGKNRTDLVITDADAQMIHLHPDHFNFLKQAKVLVILDSQ